MVRSVGRVDEREQRGLCLLRGDDASYGRLVGRVAFFSWGRRRCMASAVMSVYLRPAPVLKRLYLYSLSGLSTSSKANPPSSKGCVVNGLSYVGLAGEG